MALRRLIAYKTPDGFLEEILLTDTTEFGGLALTGDLDMNGNRILDLALPLLLTDGVPKSYVDYNLFLVEEPTAPNHTYTNTIASGKIVQEEWRRTADSSLLKRINYTYTGANVTTEIRRVYATDGSTIVAQTTLTYSYTGSTVTSIVTTRDV